MNPDEMGRSLTRLKMMLPQWAPKELDRDLARFWTTTLKEFSDEQIQNAFLKAAQTLTSWPAPATIKRLCQGTTLSDEENGQDIASRIEGAIHRYGYTKPSDAEKFIGALGWQVVLQCGGWVTICEVENDGLLSARKQWRELGTLISKNFYTNGANLPPALPEKRHPTLVAALKIANTSG